MLILHIFIIRMCVNVELLNEFFTNHEISIKKHQIRAHGLTLEIYINICTKMFYKYLSFLIYIYKQSFDWTGNRYVRNLKKIGTYVNDSTFIYASIHIFFLSIYVPHIIVTVSYSTR